MSKKILILSASLRAGSNSETLANAFADGARAAGHTVEVVSLRGKSIAFCRGCLACQTLGRCVIDDDAVAITEKMQHADVIVFATPIYYYEMSGQLKTLLDRANALFPSDYAFRDIYLLTSATEDEPDTDERAIRSRIGFVSGGASYYQRKRLRELTDVTKDFYPGWDCERYARLVRQFSLDERKRVCELSEGMKVKYQLAVAMSHKAELLILDEPTSGLDPVSRDELLDTFLTLCEQEGVSILFSTHITSDLDTCADTITYIQSGRVAVSGKKQALTGAYLSVQGPDAACGAALRARLIGARSHKGELDVVFDDDGKIAFNPAVELSYLDSYQQRAVLDAMALNDCTPSHAQSIRLKKLAQEGLLDDQIVYAVLAETKPNQQEQLKFKREELRKYFPSGYTEEQMRRDIIKGLELLKRQRERNRDAR